MIPHFILVDDQPMNNIICRAVVKKGFPTANIRVFVDPYAALAFIKATYAEDNASDAILFLDINMFPFSGWDFLEAFERFDNKVKQRIKIYILSSSGDLCDKQLAAENKNVLEFIEQPLTLESLKRVMAK